MVLRYKSICIHFIVILQYCPFANLRLLSDVSVVNLQQRKNLIILNLLAKVVYHNVLSFGFSFFMKFLVELFVLLFFKVVTWQRSMNWLFWQIVVIINMLAVLSPFFQRFLFLLNLQLSDFVENFLPFFLLSNLPQMGLFFDYMTNISNFLFKSQWL